MKNETDSYTFLSIKLYIPTFVKLYIPISLWQVSQICSAKRPYLQIPFEQKAWFLSHGAFSLNS